MLSVASPVPTDPNRKLESFARTAASGGGYTTRSWSGPRTRGTAGNAPAEATVSRTGAAGRMSTVGGVAGGALERAHATTPAAAVSAARRRAEIMAARYLATFTYATRTLTLPAPIRRFGTLGHQVKLWMASQE